MRLTHIYPVPRNNEETPSVRDCRRNQTPVVVQIARKRTAASNAFSGTLFFQFSVCPLQRLQVTFTPRVFDELVLCRCRLRFPAVEVNGSRAGLVAGQEVVNIDCIPFLLPILIW
ncbi:hypothetical protein ACLOJK_036178 [Asimina triloba]